MLVPSAQRRSSVRTGRQGARLLKEFKRELTAEKPREAVIADALQSLTVPLARHGYEIQTQTDSTLTYARKYRPWFVWAPVIFFPIGGLVTLLLAIFFVEYAYITLSFEQDGGTTTMRVAGEGTSKVANAFETLTL